MTEAATTWDQPDALDGFVERMGGYLEESGMPRLAGRMLGHLLVCEPEQQSSEELARALQASSGGVSTNARLLIRMGYVERLGRPGDRRTFYRLRDHAFDLALQEGAQSMGKLRQLADEGLAMVGGEPPRRGDRLRQMRELAAFMETEIPRLHQQFRAER